MKKIWFVLGILLIVLFFVLAFVYFATAKSNYKKEEIKLNLENVTVIEQAHVKYLLNEIGAWQLHNPPISSDRPVIQVIVDNQEFYVAVERGVISISRDSMPADIKISTTSDEAKKVLASSNIKEAVKSSVQSGKIDLELIAGYTELFSKGYLSLYQDLTGKSFTGSVVRIFSG